MKITIVSGASQMIEKYQQAEQLIKDRNKLGIKLGVERVQTLLKSVGNPQNKINAIHVAGTNGKGSTIFMLEKALIDSGYSVGVFSSPSFTGIRGHITINQQEICEDKFVKLLNELLPYIEILDNKNNHPTSFEIITVISLMFFHRHAQFSLIETGMGGRDDTTNVVNPLLSIITNVAMDHTQFLGNTYEEITLHKAGIIKKNRPVVIGEVNNESEHVIFTKAKFENAPMFQLGKNYTLTKTEKGYKWVHKLEKFTLSINHLPNYQLNNIANVIMALTYIESLGFPIDKHYFLKNLSSINLPGRFELISDYPAILLDSAHNVKAMRALIDSIDHKFPSKTVHILFSAFKDKDVMKMIEVLLAKYKHISLTTFSHERALSKDEIQNMSSDNISIIEDWHGEVKEILKQKSNDQLFVITGSLHFIVAVRHHIIKSF